MKEFITLTLNEANEILDIVAEVPSRYIAIVDKMKRYLQGKFNESAPSNNHHKEVEVENE